MTMPLPIESKAAAPQPMAVIDIGTDSIRLAIAEPGPDGMKTLESLSQSVSLGHDTFTLGHIEKETIEECVETLRSFKQVLAEFGINDPRQVRAVATSAIREASNQEAVLNRLYVATGIEVEALDVAEGTRLTYLSVYPYLKKNPALLQSDVLILEVGSGSSELIWLHDQYVVYHNTFRLGAVRLLESVENRETFSGRSSKILKRQIERAALRIRESVSPKKTPKLILLGGQARFAMGQLDPGWDRGTMTRLAVSKLSRLTKEIMNQSSEELVKKYHIPIAHAETLGITLRIYVEIARSFEIKNLLISDRTLRDGLLIEMTAQDAWGHEFKDQIIRSAMELGRRFHIEERHAKHVAWLSGQLYEALESQHGLAPRYRILLHVASLLHETGLFISDRSHHKHSLYIIQNSDLFGLGSRDVAVVALVARYHRRAKPSPQHPVYADLDRENRIVVSKLASILRVADALERSHTQRIQQVACSVEEGSFVITVPNVDDLTLEQFAMNSKANLFEEVFGLNVVLRKGQQRESLK